MPARRTSSIRNRETAAASDSDADTPLVVSSRNVNVPASSSKRKKRSAPEPELIEIFSSDEDVPPRKRQATAPPKDQIKHLQQENRNLKQKCSKLEKVEGELAHARREIGELKLASKRSGKVDAGQLEDLICCEICTTTIWTPYILSGCGHTFCQKCLIEWFGTTLAQHMAAHPAWRPTNQSAYHLLNANIRNHPFIAAVIAQQGPQPGYTCPTCRAAVNTRPIEDYSLKAIVHAVATSVGESSPKKDPVVVKRRGKGKAKAVDGPFDGFFGRDA